MKLGYHYRYCITLIIHHNNYSIKRIRKYYKQLYVQKLTNLNEWNNYLKKISLIFEKDAKKLTRDKTDNRNNYITI